MMNFSLRSVLIFPYVALVIVLAVAIGTLSYFTGSHAVLTVSEHLLKETVSRISQAVDRHVVGSMATLEAAFPDGMLAPVSIEPDLTNIRTRFWIATSLHIDPNNYVYYGNKAGQAIGLFRHSFEEGEIRIKYKAEDHRDFYQIDGINGLPHSRTVEKKLFDPRQRPWYQAALTASHDTWTSVYIDFGTHDLVATRSRQVLDSKQEIDGVVATDMPLRALNDFVSNLEISANGVAFIIESDGNLIASSCSPNVRQNDTGENIRVNAAESGHPLLTEIYQHLLPYLSQERESPKPRTFFYKNSASQEIHVAFNKFEDGAGLEWINVVALPSEDFMEGIQNNVVRTHIRKDDFVARYAGDEFIIALNDVQSKKDLEPIRNNIEKALSAPLESFDSSSLTLGGAIGEAHFPDDAKNATDLLIVADRNMYAHKIAIKSRFAL